MQTDQYASIAPVQTPRRRRVAWLLSGIATLTLVLSAAATQFAAFRLHYDPLLGPAWMGQIYPPWAIVTWTQAPWAAQARQTWDYLEIGGAGIAVLSVVISLVIARGAQRPIRHEGLHGTAAFANRAQLDTTGLLPPTPGLPWPGVYVGGWQAPDGSIDYLRHYGPEHVICIAPLRSGKGVACVVPTLLSWPHSAVIYDEKGELWEYSSGWRSSEAGNTVLRWEPRSPDDSIAWNPLNEVRLCTEFEYGDVANIVEILSDPGVGRRDPHFDEVGSRFLIGLVLHVMYEHAVREASASLADVLATLNNPMHGGVSLYRAMADNKWLAGKRHIGIAETGASMLNKESREQSGVRSTADRYLKLFNDPIVARNTGNSNFRIANLMDNVNPVSLYIVTRGQDKMTMRPLVRLFVTVAMGQLSSAALLMANGQQISPHRHRLLMLLDEFPSLGKLERFQDAMAKCAGYGIKVFLLAQSREQIVDIYGMHENITGNCHIKVMFAPGDEATAKWISGLLGTSTVVVEDISESGPRGLGKRNFSRNSRSVPRAVLTADEVMRLRLPGKGADGKTIVTPGEVLIHVGGHFPIRGVQSLYFRDPEFQRRASIARFNNQLVKVAL